MASTDLLLLANRYILGRDNTPLFTITNEQYAKIIYAQIHKIEMENGAAFATDILNKIVANNGLPHISVANTLDIIRARILWLEDKKSLIKSIKEPIDSKGDDVRGKKYRCEKCCIGFYDMKKEDAVCPKCKRHKSSCSVL